MKRPPRTAPLAAALISAVAVAVLTLCTTLFLRSYRSAVVEAARTNSAQAVSQVVGAVGNYVSTMDSAVAIVMERLDDDTASRDAFLSAFLTARPEVAAITAYDADGQLLDCWAQEGRKPKDAILRNLSFDLTTARRLGHGYISTPHVESIFEGYYPWVVSVIRIVPEGDTARCWLSVDLSFKELAATISNVGIGQHGYCYLMDERGNMVYHPQQQLLYAGLKKEEAGRHLQRPARAGQPVARRRCQLHRRDRQRELLADGPHRCGYRRIDPVCGAHRGLGVVPLAVPPLAAAGNRHGAV